MRVFVKNVFAVLALGSLAPLASADWNVVYLDPEVGFGSSAYTVNGTHQAGQVDGFASLWNGTAASYVDLNPGGSIGSDIASFNGNQQFGTATFSGFLDHAGLWNGTAASFVDLNPDFLDETEAEDSDGVQQVGWGIKGQSRYACLWSGTKASFVDLTPAGANAWAHGVHNGKQVGAFMTNNVESAALWSGTAASLVNLHPVGASHSQARAVYGDYQGGSANFTGGWEAVLWHGTAESYTQLSPVLGASSGVYGMFDGVQVGGVYLNDAFHASMWNGTRESWFDLNTLLSADYTDANAFSVWGDGANLYIGGQATNINTNRLEAVVWVQSVPEPASTAAMALGIIGLVAKRRSKK